MNELIRWFEEKKGLKVEVRSQEVLCSNLYPHLFILVCFQLRSSDFRLLSFTILQSFNPSILQSFNLSIFQSFNLISFQLPTSDFGLRAFFNQESGIKSQEKSIFSSLYSCFLSTPDFSLFQSLNKKAFNKQFFFFVTS